MNDDDTWAIETACLKPERLEGLDAVVHLAGESVNGLRWTEEKKRAIRDSRVSGPESSSRRLGKLKMRPKVLRSRVRYGILW